MSATPPSHHVTHGSYLMPSLEHATVADAMHPGIMTCDPGASATDVARMMASHHVHCIAVMGVSHEHPGESPIWSIVSDIDLIRAGVEGDPEMTASTMALAPVVTVELSTPLLEAARLMLKHASSHLLVVDPGAQRPVGMISTLDIAGILAWGEA
jgi:CBS domain-containing protein